jgi:Lysozyme like domain
VPEPDAARAYNMGPAANLNINTEAAQASIAAMTAAMKELEKALQQFGNNAYTIADKINRHLKSIGDTATKVTQQLAGMGASLAGVGAVGPAGGTGGRVAAVGAAGGPAGGGAAPSGTGRQSAQQWVSSATQAIGRVLNQEAAGGIAGGLSLGTFLGTGGEEGTAGFLKDVALSPLRYLRSRINTNRETAIMASGGLNMQAIQQGTNTRAMMGTIARFPGSIYGTPTDLLQLFGNAPQFGASYGFGGQTGQGVRAAGFFRGIREMQMMTPMAPVGELAGTLGGYAGNTQAQQRAMMFTGGAMGMITTGGRQKSLSEWAESILRWFEGLRPGANRGKGFNYGDLMAQYFPGSNIDAWFDVNGVPQPMRDYWWTYALGKANKTQDTTVKGGFQIGADENNVAWQRLRAASELTRTEFSLAGKMAGQYAQRESSNRWFNELMGGLQEQIIPAISNSIFRWIQYLPDSVEDLLMSVAERGASALFGGGVFGGGDVPNAAGDIGDIGDAGGYGAVGGTGLAGLHPDLKKKIGKMMRANPRLRVNSGLRDTGLQSRLKDKGYRSVSGKPSAHTRGLAADLGPASEYGWLVANAGKFGLASGIGHGEPWHVGMRGDIPGVGDIFDEFLESVRDVGESPEGMAGFITKMLNLVLGGFNKLMKAAPAETQFAAGPEDLYQRLVEGSREVTLGQRPRVFGAGVTLGGGDGGGGLGSAFFGGGGVPTGESTTGRGLNLPQEGTLTWEQVTQAAHAVGFTGTGLQTIVAIAGGESGRNTRAHNATPPDNSYGLWQINMIGAMGPQRREQWGLAVNEELYDPVKNAVAAYDLSGGGVNFRPWTVYTSGRYQQYMDEAKTAMTNTGLGDIGDVPLSASSYDQMVPRNGMAQRPIVFQNTFNLQSGIGGYGAGPNGGIDIRRTVNLIADHLEDEMKRRLVRSA